MHLSVLCFLPLKNPKQKNPNSYRDEVLQVHFVPQNSVKFGAAPVNAIGVSPQLPSGGALSITFRKQIPPVSDYFSKPTAFIQQPFVKHPEKSLCKLLVGVFLKKIIFFSDRWTRK